MRRLIDWFLGKIDAEVTGYLLTEKVYKRRMAVAEGGGPPDAAAIRAARANIQYHLRYIGYLAARRNWLAGRELTFADLAAAAELSTVDYLGEVPWEEDAMAKAWYARMKSRPSFRALLADRCAACRPQPTTPTSTSDRRPGGGEGLPRRRLQARGLRRRRRRRRRTRIPEAAARLARISRRRPSRHDGVAARPKPSAAPTPKALWPEARSRRHGRHELRAGHAIRWRRWR